MRIDALDYELPRSAIAQRPLPERDAARLLVMGQRGLAHRCVTDLPALLPEGALVVINDTRVRRARVVAEKESGGRVELLFLRPVGGGQRPFTWSVLASSNRPLRVGMSLRIADQCIRVVGSAEGGEKLVALDAEVDPEQFFEKNGRLPLPPYIRRPEEEEDAERYQTVFAEFPGSAAAPTAGLHLSRRALEELSRRGHPIGRVTLHVGAGTFLPVRTDDLDSHEMHAEAYRVSEELAEQVRRARADDREVVAIGTTVVRALESARSATRPGLVESGEGETRLLIQPGYRFSIVDAMLTNFHAPRSTLLALVAAFVGVDEWRRGYAEALASGYRFLSYGDATWLPEPAMHARRVRS